MLLILNKKKLNISSKFLLKLSSCIILLFYHSFLEGKTDLPTNLPEEISIPFELQEIQVKPLPKLFYLDIIHDKKVVAGKKITIIDPKESPSFIQNNFRHIIGEVPGMMVADVNNDSWTSLTYRGMGDPHESFNILNLRNGLPSTPDPYGYPAAYYVPPFEALEKIEFFRGGSSLLFGPQPGGALNFVLKRAPSFQQKSLLQTTQLGGSFSRYRSHTEVSRGGEKWGSLISFHTRGQQGFRETNSHSQIINPRLNLRYSLDSSSSLWFDFDMYQGQFGEPGGLAKPSNSGNQNILTLNNPRSVTLKYDRMEIDRRSFVVSWEKTWNAQTSSTLESWYSHFKRQSFRQTLGESPPFGGRALGHTNLIQDQQFFNKGLQGRVQHHYKIKNQEQVLTTEIQVTDTHSPFIQKSGSSPIAREGSLTRRISRQTQTQAFVIENAFVFEDWIVSPGTRFENITQRLHENFNTLSSMPLKQDQKNSHIALLGLGTEYKFTSNSRLYSNFSQGYKPPSFQDTMPLGITDTVSEDLKEAYTHNYEAGVKGSYKVFDYDLSLFRIDFSNIFGRVNSHFQNVGASRSEGLDLLVSYTLNFQWVGFMSASFLHARFIQGPLKGRRTQYSPEQLFRGGLSYLYGPQSFAKLQVQSLASSFGDDGNSLSQKLEPHSIADLTGQHHLKNITDYSFLLNWGIHNITNQKVPTRVRSNGYEPAEPRTFFVGLTLQQLF
jgi:Fe(3+) dicitrate transport protein